MEVAANRNLRAGTWNQNLEAICYFSTPSGIVQTRSPVTWASIRNQLFVLQSRGQVGAECVWPDSPSINISINGPIEILVVEDTRVKRDSIKDILEGSLPGFALAAISDVEFAINFAVLQAGYNFRHGNAVTQLKLIMIDQGSLSTDVPTSLEALQSEPLVAHLPLIVLMNCIDSKGAENRCETGIELCSNEN